MNDCDFMQRIGAAVFSNLYPFVGLDLNALRANQTTASPVSPLFVGNLCSLLFNLHMLGIRQDTLELIKLLLAFVFRVFSFEKYSLFISFSFLDVRPLESKMNSQVTPAEYHLFTEQMFYMYTKIAQYLRLVFESNVELCIETMHQENMVQLVALLAYFPDKNLERSENCWQTKINLAHLIIHILLQPTSPLHQLINQTIAQHAAALCSKGRLITCDTFICISS